MKNYILNRLRIDAQHTLDMAENEGVIPHEGVKGRFRELLVDNLLIPWLPPYVSCGTGVIIDAEAAVRSHNQDDIIIYDSSLVPPVMASAGHAPNGVFLFNSVLLRIEVKSTLEKRDMRDFVDASVEVSKLKFAVTKESRQSALMGTLNMLFAFDSDLAPAPYAAPDKDLERLLNVMLGKGVSTESGIVSSMCIPGRGLWKIARDPAGLVRWQKLRLSGARDHIAWWTAVVSSTCYQQHASRQGRDPQSGVEGGIGNFVPGGDDVWMWL